MVRGAVSVVARIVCAKNFRPHPLFVKDHAHFEYSMLLGKSLSVVTMKKRTVSQAEYALQLLIHEISHDDSCQIYIFEVQQ